MSGTEKSCSIEDIRKVFKQKGWDTDYTVKGNEPYSKGTKVFWRTPDGLRIETQSFDKNDDLFVALLDPKYHPGKIWPPNPGLFPEMEWVENNRASKRLEVLKRMEQWNDLKLALDDFRIDTRQFSIGKHLEIILKRI